MIIDIQKSPKKNKRFRVTMDNGKKYDFGYVSGSTYIDNLSREKRSAYLKRHMANKIEYKLITELVPSPALFAAYLLWGPYETIDDNITNLNNLWKNKHG